MIDRVETRFVKCVNDSNTAGQLHRGNVYRVQNEAGAYTYFFGHQDGFLTRRFVDCEAPSGGKGE
jgi:hypothetical protein